MQARGPGRGPGLGYAGRALEEEMSHAPTGSSRCRLPSRVRHPRRRRPARGDQGRAAELVAGALDRPGAAPRAGPEPRGGRGDDRGPRCCRRAPVTVNARGTYLFVDVTIDPKAAPGPRTIGIRTASGTAAIPLEILAPLPRAGRFQGFSPDDAMYLVMPDRFANGDPSNDDPARLEGPPRPLEGALLPRGRPARRHRAAALPEGPRRDRPLAQPLVRQRQPPERARDLRRARRSPTTTATAPWTSTRSRSASATSRRCASWSIAPTPWGSR